MASLLRSYDKLEVTGDTERRKVEDGGGQEEDEGDRGARAASKQNLSLRETQWRCASSAVKKMSSSVESKGDSE